jgi:hypothetical protein
MRRAIPIRSTILTAGSLLLAASCGIGGGGGAGRHAADVTPDPALDQGAYSVDDFQYTDPNPPQFHPLTQPVYVAWAKDEATFLVGSTGQGWMRDDADTGFDSSVSLPSGTNSDMVVIDSKSADLFGDGRPSLVVLGSFTDPSDQNNTKLRVRVLADGPAGWSILGSFDLGAPGENYQGGRLAIGDVDGDYRDEIVVAATHDLNTSWVRVFEDPVQGNGYGVLAHSFDFANTDQVRVAAVQLDDDPARELVVHTGLGNAALGTVYDDATHGYAALNSALYAYDSGIFNVELLAVNVDDDVLQEIVVLLTTNGGIEQIVFDDARGGFKKIRDDTGIWQGQWSAFDPALMLRGAVGDVDGDGKDEIVWASNLGDDACGLQIFWSDGTNEFRMVDNMHDWRVVNVATLDDDHDNKKEIVFAAIENDYYTKADTCYCWRFDDDGTNLNRSDPVTRGVASHQSLALSGDDFDSDGCRLRYDGNKYQQLPDPIVLAILAAPPTKTGISQDQNASSVNYTISVGSSDAFEYKNMISASFGAGVEFKVLGNEAEVSAKIKGDAEWSTQTEDSTQRSTEFTAGSDHDTVVFTGTLHMVYEYEILVAADPSAVGTIMTINVPLATRTYKWTRELVESTFGKDTVIPAGVLTHTIGDPSSYKSHDDALALLNSYEGWDGGNVTVGQGSGANGVTLSLEDKVDKESGWSLGGEVEARVKLGPATIDATVGYDHSWLYTNTTSSGTSYNGTIADISGHSDYFQWGYDVGLFVYGFAQENHASFQVIDFWTDPWGSGYGR